MYVYIIFWTRPIALQHTSLLHNGGRKRNSNIRNTMYIIFVFLSRIANIEDL